MHYRKLGNSGLDVSVLSMGTNDFGHRTDESGAVKLIDKALELGVNLFDTSITYSNGFSEEVLGRALKGRRQKALIATKFFFGHNYSRQMNNYGGSRSHILRSVDDSLRRLQTDYIDLYMMHTLDKQTPIEETLRALDDLVKQGKVRYTGCCNFPAWRVVEAAWTAKACNLNHFVATQNHYNLLRRGLEVELAPACLATGVSFIPYFPLESGMLTGKYTPGEAAAPTGTRFSSEGPKMPGQYSPQNIEKAHALDQWAKQRGHTVAQLALAWLLANPAIDTVLAGATKPEQLAENTKGLDWQLTPDELQAVDALVPLATTTPTLAWSYGG